MTTSSGLPYVADEYMAIVDAVKPIQRGERYVCQGCDGWLHIKRHWRGRRPDNALGVVAIFQWEV
ncbi:MAG: hypothetical protein HN673_06300 [Rhodospirillales bacterium]|jgi:hypothetical protein|nr:hypothetical protein [Rhodospirillales bacterium]